MDKKIKPKIIGWSEEVTKNLSKYSKQVTISIDTVEPRLLSKSDINILLHFEPSVIRESNRSIIEKSSYYDLILTWDKSILNACKNSILFPFGDCWIDGSDRKIHNKTKNISIIASTKNQTEGHRLRHSVIKEIPMDTYGRRYNPIDNKITALKDYRFTVVIENIKQDYWFTEKLIDAFMTGTIPLYWGFDSIDEFFDPNGIIKFNTTEELTKMLPTLTEELYLNKLEHIKNNFKLSFKYSSIWVRLDKEIKKFLNNE